MKYPTLILLLVSQPAFADDHESALAKYISDEVVAVAYVDLTKIEAVALLDWGELLGFSQPDERAEVTKIAQQMQRRLDAWTDAGARYVYWLFRLSDVQRGPLWVVPISAGGDPNTLKQRLQQGLPEQLRDERDVWAALLPNYTQVDGNALLGANSVEQLRELQAAKPAQRQEFADAWQTLGQAGAGLVVLGNADSRRVVRELFPQLPPPAHEIDGKFIADSLLWGGVALKLPPELDAELVIQTRDEQTVKTLQQTLDSGLFLLQQLPAVRKEFGERDLKMFASTLSPQVEGARIRIRSAKLTSDIATLKKVIGPPLLRARQAAQRQVRMNKFKNILLAMHNFHDKKKSFPTAATSDDAGKPLLSWRVQVLPELGQIDLYRQFHLDEPWDSPHNRTLIKKMPDTYADPDSLLRKANRAGSTTFVVPTGKYTMFSGPTGITYKDVVDGTSNTIMLVEVVPEKAVIWTKPDDWQVDFENPHKGVRREDRDWFTAGYADAHVHIEQNSIPAEKLRALITPMGGEIIE